MKHNYNFGTKTDDGTMFYEKKNVTYHAKQQGENSLTLTLHGGGGEGAKKNLPKEEGREGRGSNSGLIACLGRVSKPSVWCTLIRKVQKNYLPKEEGTEGLGSNPGPTTC